MKLYVGNFPFASSEEDLKDLFTDYPSVVNVQLIIDRATGKSKGFGFVEFTSDDEARKAIEDLNETVVNGKTIIVNEARPQVKRENRFNDSKRRFR